MQSKKCILANLSSPIEKDGNLFNNSALNIANTYLQTKPHNLVDTKVIRDLNPSDINKLISVSGMITRTSNVIPDLRCVKSS